MRWMALTVDPAIVATLLTPALAEPMQDAARAGDILRHRRWQALPQLRYRLCRPADKPTTGHEQVGRSARLARRVRSAPREASSAGDRA